MLVMMAARQGGFCLSTWETFEKPATDAGTDVAIVEVFQKLAYDA